MAASSEISGLCEEAVACQDAHATIKCVECGTMQCHACDELLHMGKLASHKRVDIYTQPLCERNCSKSATVKCDECGVKLYDECDKLLHQGKKRGSHAKVRLYTTTTIKEETMADKEFQKTTLVEEHNQQESELDSHDQNKSELDKGESVLSSSFLLVNDKEEIMVCVYVQWRRKVGARGAGAPPTFRRDPNKCIL